MDKITLTAARVNAKLTQKEVAEKLGVSEKTVQNWESGYTNPKISKFFNLCEVYGVSVCDIILP